MMNTPQARKDKLLSTKLEDEVVIYDPETKQAHSLNRTAVAVWNHSDGNTAIADLQQRVSADVGTPVSEAAVWLALRQLERANLLTGKLASIEPMTRRHLLHQAGKFGAAAALATPMVMSAIVPAAAATCSVCGTVLVGATVTNCQCAGTFNPATCSGTPVLSNQCVNLTASLGSCGTTIGVGGVTVITSCPAGSACVAFANNGCAGSCHSTCTLIGACTC
jgi:Coenzyme PQQ synthesis protein D (PqqD)